MCFCGSALGSRHLYRLLRKTPRGWAKWSPGKQARWLEETSKHEAQERAQEVQLAESWMGVLRSAFKSPAVKSVAIMHHFCRTYLDQEPAQIVLLKPVPLSRLDVDMLLDLPQDVALVVKRG
ncbi:hypothetical protein EON79_04745 [bacterium]|nr:MAG: hypothetical protein EON79_04745 [bacterium]